MNEKNKLTQRQKIIAYMKENGCATIRELFIYCNINSPSKRLSELRKLGLIESKTNEKVNASGDKIRFSVYYLSPKGETVA